MICNYVCVYVCLCFLCILIHVHINFYVRVCVCVCVCTPVLQAELYMSACQLMVLGEGSGGSRVRGHLDQ